MTLKDFIELTDDVEPDAVLTSVMFNDGRQRVYIELDSLTIRETEYVDKEGNVKKGVIIAVL
jgi:hypothetical protein